MGFVFLPIYPASHKEQPLPMFIPSIVTHWKPISSNNNNPKRTLPNSHSGNS